METLQVSLAYRAIAPEALEIFSPPF